MVSRARPLPTLLLAAFCCVASACKDSTGPSASGLTFPSLPGSVIAEWCVRGDRTTDGAISGTIAASDCVWPFGGYYETWRIRVLTDGTHRFEASSAFDNVLSVGRVDSLVAGEAALTLVAFDDDSGDDFNALIGSVTLQAGKDYLLFVNGYDDFAIGAYAVSMTRVD